MRLRVLLFASLAALGSMAGPAGALPESPGSDQSDGRAVTVPSFTESPGCYGPYGVRGPYATRSGGLPDSEPIYGPWGDFFGRTIGEVRSHLVLVDLPGGVPVWVHERVEPALRMVIANLQREAAAGNTYTIRSWDTWSFNPATIPPGRHLSFHAVGAAIDVNSTTNPYRDDNVLVTDMPDWFVRAWTDAGWCWGGDWQSIKDPMHFSWRGPLWTAGYDVPPPMPPDTAITSYGTAVTVPTSLEAAAPGVVQLVADLDRDGAPDAVRIRPWTAGGHVNLEASSAHDDFETCTIADVSFRPPAASGGYLLADYTSDGRPDLWAFDDSGEVLRIEIYRWDRDYFVGPVLTTPVPAGGAHYLAGDHDRDGAADLYVVRNGTPAHLEIWEGPGFERKLVDTDLPFFVTSASRVALGDRDVDGIPDVYVLAPGDAARLRVARGGHGFAGVGGIATAVAAHDGIPLQIADYDGDGRDDLVFFEADGTFVVYLGGVRSPGTDLTTWFSGSWDRDWTYGAGCMPNPGFETEPGFTDVRYAVTDGSGSAFTYPNPETGVWTIAALDWSWWRHPDGTVVDLEPFEGPQGPGYAALVVAGGRTVVEVRRASDGFRYRTVAVSDRTDPADLAVVASGGSQVLAVAFGGDPPHVVITNAVGATLADVPLAGMDPKRLVAAGDGTVVAVGQLPGGTPGVRVVSVDEGLVAQAKVRTRRTVEDATFVSAAGDAPDRVAVLLSHSGDRNGRVALVDAATAETVELFSTMPIRNGVIVSVPHADSPVLVTAARNTNTARVRVDGRDPDTGARLWGAGARADFDPSDVDLLSRGEVAITGHRLGDGNVAIDLWDPIGGVRTG